MLISPIFYALKINHTPSFNLRQNIPCFKGNLEADTFEKTTETPKLKRGQIADEHGKIFTRPDTNMFRYDLEWRDFGYYLNDRFSNEDKVNTYVYACSSGEEAYSLSMLLQEMNSHPEKFFPINAKDINSELVEKNIQNKQGDKIMKNSYLPARRTLNLNGEEIKKYVTLEIDEQYRETEKLTDKAAGPVEFSCANILDDIENVDSDTPSIIMCRNMWPYVNPDEYEAFASKLYDKLAGGSVVAIGGYDYKGEDGRKNSDKFPEALLSAGFQQTDIIMDYHEHVLVFEKN